jgi:hypothetical protein
MGGHDTPAFCQSFDRRRQVAPEPKPGRVGKWCQRMPVLNTNRTPHAEWMLSLGPDR